MEGENQNLMNMLLGAGSENGGQQNLEGFGQQFNPPVSGHTSSMQPPLTSPMGQQGSPYHGQMMPQSPMMQQSDMMSPPYSQSQSTYSDTSFQGYPGYNQQRMGTSPMYANYGQNGSFLSSLTSYGSQGRTMGQYTPTSSVGYGPQGFYPDLYQPVPPKSPAAHQQLQGSGYPSGLQGQMGVGGNGSSYPTSGYPSQSSMSPLQKPMGQSFFPPRSPASQQIHSPPNMTANYPGQTPTSPMAQNIVGHGPRRSSTSPVSSMIPQGMPVYSMPQRQQYPTTTSAMAQNQSSCMFAHRLEKMSAQHQYQTQMTSTNLPGPTGSVVSPSRRTSFPGQPGLLPGMHTMKPSTTGPVSPVQKSPPQIGKSPPPFKPMRSPPPYQAHQSPPSFQKTATTMPTPYPPQGVSDARKTGPPGNSPDVGQPPPKKARKSTSAEKSSMQKLEEVAESVSTHLAEGLSHAVGNPVDRKTAQATSKSPETDQSAEPNPAKESEDNKTEKMSEASNESSVVLKDTEMKVEEDKKVGQESETVSGKDTNIEQDKSKDNKNKEDNKEDTIKEDKIKDSINEDNIKEDKIREDKIKEDKIKEDEKKGDKVKEDKSQDKKDKEGKNMQDKPKLDKDKEEKIKEGQTKEEKLNEEKATWKDKDNSGIKQETRKTRSQCVNEKSKDTDKEKTSTHKDLQQHTTKKAMISPVRNEKKSQEMKNPEANKNKSPSSDKAESNTSKDKQAMDNTKPVNNATSHVVDVDKPPSKLDIPKKFTASVKDSQPKTLLSKTMSKSPGTKVSISRSGHPPTIQATVIAKGQSAQSNQQVLVAKTAGGQMYLIQGNVLIPVQNITVQQPNGEKGNKVICVNQGQGKSSHVMVGNITPNLTQKPDKMKSHKPRYDDDDSDDELRDGMDGKMEIDLACREKSLLSPTAELADNDGDARTGVSSQTEHNTFKSRFARSPGGSSRFGFDSAKSAVAASKASNLEKSLNAIKAKLELEKNKQAVDYKKRIGRPPGSKDKHKRKTYFYKKTVPEERIKQNTTVEKRELVSEKEHKKPLALNIPTVSKSTRTTKRPKMMPPPHSPTRTLMVQPRGGVDGDKWVCSFCGKPSNHSALGILYGPYKAKLSRERTDSSRECMSPDKLLSPGSRLSELPTELEGTSIDLWIHKDCGGWSQGLYMLGRTLYGLEQAVESAASHKCSQCDELGATLQCFKRGCNSIYHFACARDSGCAFVEENFTIFCSVHK